MQRHSKNNKKTIRIDYKTRQRICLFLCETKQMTEHQDERSVLMLRLILNKYVNKSILFRQWPTKTWRNELRSNERGRSLAFCDRFLRGEIGCCDSPLSSMTDAASTMLTASKAKVAAMAKLSARDMTLRLLSMVGGGGADADEVRKTYRKRAQRGRGKCGRLGQCQIRTDQSSRRIILTAAPIDSKKIRKSALKMFEIEHFKNETKHVH